MKMLKMDKLDKWYFCKNKNLCVMYTATMKHLKIGKKSDVIAVSMAIMTFSMADI